MCEDKLPLVGITMGDPTGIGPEIIVKLFLSMKSLPAFIPLVFGDPHVLEQELSRQKAGISIQRLTCIERFSWKKDLLPLLPLSELDPENIKAGAPDQQCAEAMARYIVDAARAALEGKIDAMVTGPINKEALQQAGYAFPGHTELLAQMSGTEQFVMMLAGSRLKVALVTTHCAIHEVSQSLSIENIFSTINITNQGLKEYFGTPSPRIAVCALNPHAGEGGLFGDEETAIITPAVQKALEKGIDVAGPLPSDTLFYYAVQGKYDAVVCMYHDQGLIPLKLLHFEDGVNITLGLPIIRTSVDHGTAYDIVGQGRANPNSLREAVKMASSMAGHRLRTHES